MDTCRLAIFRLSSANAADFVAFWSRGRNDPAERKYAQNILQPGSPGRYDLARVTRLMEWRAGRLAKAAPAFAKKIDLAALNNFRSTPFSVEALEDFWRHSASNLATSEANIGWPIFVCHMAHPEAVPLYDLDVANAWNFIAGDRVGYATSRGLATFEDYLAYRESFNELLSQSGAEPHQLEASLAAFGQFLASATASSHLMAEIDRLASECDATAT